MSAQVESSIVANEIVAPGSNIVLTFRAPVDPRSAQAAIHVFGPCGPVRSGREVAKRGRVVIVQIPEDARGSHQLVIEELSAAKGGELVDRFHLPFTVAPLNAGLPDGFRAEHAVRLAVGELDVTRIDMWGDPHREFVDVIKAVDRDSGKQLDLAFDQDGQRVDMDGLLAEQAKRRFSVHGRIHPTLYDLLDKGGSSSFPVVVWPSIELPAAPYEKPSEGAIKEPPPGEREVAALVSKATKSLQAAVRRVGIDVKVGPDIHSPGLRATATGDQIRKLSQSATVGVILYDDPSAVEDLRDSIAVARSNRAHTAGFDGTGIRVAVWEDGPRDTTDLTFAGRFTTSPTASAHARLTSAVIKNVEANQPHGHAPDCDLFSANSGDTDALRWAVADQHCTVVSQSFHRGTEPSGSGLQSDDLLKDWLALRWPYPTILQAAGNFWNGDSDMISPPESEYVNHKGFNSLAVGNHNDAATAMSGDSVFRNPTSSHGDRELPEIAANGTGVSAVGESMSGTSFAAPAAAGVTALLQDVDSTLCSWPEGCRAILLATAARNVSGGTWWADVAAGVDASDGAGAIDAEAGVAVAQQRRWRNAPATRRGWDVGTLSSSSIGGDRLATFRYFVEVPRLLYGSSVKVALAWDSAVTSILGMVLGSSLTIDLDLIVRDSAGRQVAVSASYDNSYEVVEFAASRGETYEIVIRRWSGTDDVWFGVAWNVSSSWRFPFFDQSILQATFQA
jgi:hypothetical protein